MGQVVDWKHDLDCSHYHGRGKESVRFDPENADAACRACHNYVATAEGQQWLDAWKLRQLGEQRYNLLLLRANTPAKRDDVLTKMYLKQLINELT